MQSLKSVLSRKDEQENLRNFLFSLSVVVVLVVSFFGFHAVSLMIHASPDHEGRQIASFDVDPPEKVE
jgi:hypothetical protein